MSFTARAIINKSALRQNFAAAKARAPDANVMVIVKANAYGHGIVKVARALTQADAFGVARVSEAAALRSGGISQPIALLEGVFTQRDMSTAAEQGCELVVHTQEQIDLLNEYQGDFPFVVWVKVDSGMHRLGFEPALAGAAIEQLLALSCVAEVRLMSHFASAELELDYQSQGQLACIIDLLERYDLAYSIANSPALFSSLPQFDIARGSATGRPVWVRPGISIYGISPFPDISAAQLALTPAMNFESKLIAVRDVPAGERIGYGGVFCTQRESRIGIAATGYGDGYPRMSPNGTPVLVDGELASIAGRVSMDMLAIDVTDIPSARFGSSVRLWGEGLPAEQIATALGSSAYELVTRVSERVSRHYQD